MKTYNCANCSKSFQQNGYILKEEDKKCPFIKIVGKNIRICEFCTKNILNLWRQKVKIFLPGKKTILFRCNLIYCFLLYYFDSRQKKFAVEKIIFWLEIIIFLFDYFLGKN